jgi:hypothetical protein
MVLSAVRGLRLQLPRMAEYRDRARGLAAALQAEPGFVVAPEPPHINSFQLHLPVAPDALRTALLAWAEREAFWLGGSAAASALPGHAMVEIVIGDASEDWTDAEAVAAWRQVFEAARG